MKSQAWHDGYVAGKRDRLIGIRSEYAYFVESAPGYSRDYSLGYQRGWHGLGTLYASNSRIPRSA